MEELLALLAGAGALALSPLLIPGLRPVAKSAVKGGMAVADAAKGAAAATGEQLHQLTKGLMRGGREEATGEAAAPMQAATEPAPSIEQPAPPTGPDRAAARPPVDLRPLVQAAVMSGQSLAGAAAGALAGVNKQWTGIVADAKAELAAGAQAKTAQAIPIVDAGAAPVEEPAPAEAAAEAPAEAPAAEQVVEAPVAEAPAAEPAAGAAPVAEPVGEMPVAEMAAPEAEPVAEAGAPAGGDDLRQIRGIGPKAAELLQAAGITTFEQLAGMEPEQLQALVAQAGPRYRTIHPTGWPEEARQILAQRGSS